MSASVRTFLMFVYFSWVIARAVHVIIGHALAQTQEKFTVYGKTPVIHLVVRVDCRGR